MYLEALQACREGSSIIGEWTQRYSKASEQNFMICPIKLIFESDKNKICPGPPLSN